MIRPVQKDEAFLKDVRKARETEPGRLHCWWLGQSGFLLQWEERHLLFDPYLSDSLTRKYADTDKPHVRMTERVVAPERLDFIDVVTSSHNHTDHLDAETLLPLFGACPGLQMVLPQANMDFAEKRLGGYRDAMTGLPIHGTAEVAGFRFTAVPAAHEEPGPQFAGFVVETEPWCLYHSGDTLRFAELDAALEPFSIDLAFLPINGKAPERRVAGNLNGREAAELARDHEMGLVVPCHFEMFTFNTASSDRFVETCEALGQPFRVLRAGERISLDPP